MWCYPGPLCCACGALIGAEELLGNQIDLIKEHLVLISVIHYCGVVFIELVSEFCFSLDISARMLYIIYYSNV